MQKLTNHIDLKLFNFQMDLRKEDIGTFHLEEFCHGYSSGGKKVDLTSYMLHSTIYKCLSLGDL